MYQDQSKAAVLMPEASPSSNVQRLAVHPMVQAPHSAFYYVVINQRTSAYTHTHTSKDVVFSCEYMSAVTQRHLSHTLGLIHSLTFSQLPGFWVQTKGKRAHR